MTTLYLLDVSSYLFRSYYAISRMTNPQGASTNALYGCIRSVLKLLHEQQPVHLCAVFDGPRNKESRQALYAEYKGHRKECPADLPQQIEWSADWFRWMGIPQLAVPGVEADDVIGSIAVWAETQGIDVRIASSDKDLCQLVNERVMLLNPSKDYLLVDAAKVQEIYEVTPRQIVDYLAIVGDASDNIPGLSGFGPKTASQLLSTYGSLENLLQHAADLPAKKQATVLAEREQALLSQKLARIQTDVPVPTTLQEYERYAVDNEALRAFYKEMAFSSLQSELQQQSPAASTQETPQIPDCEIILDHDKLQKALTQLKTAGTYVMDTETTSEDPLRAELVGVGLYAPECGPYYIPVATLQPPESMELFRQFLAATEVRCIGHNLKYDLHILRGLGLKIGYLYFDTILASYLLFAHAHRHNLDHVTFQLFGVTKTPIEELIGKGKQQITMAEVFVEKVAHYCAQDVFWTWHVYASLSQQITERGLDQLLHGLEMPLLRLLFEMEEVGIFVDVSQLQAMQTEFAARSDKLAEEIFSACGSRFNLNSPKQLSQVLYEQMGLKSAKRGAMATSTSAEALEDLLPQAPFVRTILAWRQLEKLRSTYLEALPTFVLPRDGRIHTTFQQSVAATGRLSSQDPNLQNIPIRSDEGKRIREAFRPQQEGWVYLSADYSQIELRLLAHMSKDPTLIEAFQHGEDIHRFTAALVHQIPIEAVTPEQRRQAKAVNFGILYGQQAYRLSIEIGSSMEEARQFIKKYFDRFPRVGEFLERCKEEARATGKSCTLTGRERLIPEINSSNGQIRAAAERLAVNSPLQGTAADLIKQAMLRCQDLITQADLESQMILQIHDELLFEAPEAELSALEVLVRQGMEQAMRLDVPLVVDVSIGRNWRECYS